jgi:hypothetical protein
MAKRQKGGGKPTDASKRLTANSVALQSNVGNKRSFDNVNENGFRSSSCSLSSLQVTMSQVDRRVQAFHPSLATSHTTSDQSAWNFSGASFHGNVNLFNRCDSKSTE